MLTRTLLNTDPFGALSREMDRLFETFAPAGTDSSVVMRGQFPMLNVWEGEEALFLEAELPGFQADDVSVLTTADSVTIKGERRIQHSDGARVIRAERAAGRFERTIGLPTPVDSERAAAEFKDGVLRITLPKAAAALPRRIQITSGDARN